MSKCNYTLGPTKYYTSTALLNCREFGIRRNALEFSPPGADDSVT